MRNIYLASILFINLAAWSLPSKAVVWNWEYVPRTGNYWVLVADGDCHSSATVFWKKDHRGMGWRVAFDEHEYINLNYSDAEEATIRAVEIFYGEHCGSENYRPRCPNGKVPASQASGSCLKGG